MRLTFKNEYRKWILATTSVSDEHFDDVHFDDVHFDGVVLQWQEFHSIIATSWPPLTLFAAAFQHESDVIKALCLKRYTTSSWYAHVLQQERTRRDAERLGYSLPVKRRCFIREKIKLWQMNLLRFGTQFQCGCRFFAFQVDILRVNQKIMAFGQTNAVRTRYERTPCYFWNKIDVVLWRSKFSRQTLARQ